jgi:hypothetical protein
MNTLLVGVSMPLDESKETQEGLMACALRNHSQLVYRKGSNRITLHHTATTRRLSEGGNPSPNIEGHICTILWEVDVLSVPSNAAVLRNRRT